MADKTSVADWSATATDNDNVGGIDLRENVMRPRDVNNAIRTVMAQIATAVEDGSLAPDLLGANVLDHGATGDGTTDDGGAFADAQTAAIAAGSKIVVVPAGTYLISTSVALATGVTWLFLGATLKTTSAISILSADTVDDWSIIGAVQLIGDKADSTETAQTGLYIKNCDRYRVEGVMGRTLKGKAFYLTGTSAPSNRGERGQFSDCAAFDCTIGRQLDAGAGAEYTAWANWNASGNDTADIIGAGNTVTVGGSIVDNTSGVELIDGSNHGHGIYSGVQINHNDTNLTATDLIYGYSFTGCHLYEGPIVINNCDGITIEGGMIDVSAITITDGANAGYTRIRNAWFDDAYGPPTVSGTGAAKLVMQGCTGPGAPAIGSFHEFEAHVYRSKGSTQALTSGTTATAIFPGETVDVAGMYNASTGVFTFLEAGVYEVTWQVVVSGTALNASSSYLEIQADNTGGDDSYTSQALSGAIPYSTTRLVFSGTVALSFGAGANLRFRLNVSGTSPVMGATDYYCLASVKKLGG